MSKAARPPDPRRVAAEVVRRVLAEGAFAAAVLSSELEKNAQLDAKDRGFATELAYGALRIGRYVDGRVNQVASKTGELDPLVRAHLWIAAHQLWFLRVPAHAAVSEAVGAVREARGERVAGFVNAVLRKLAASGPSTLADAVVLGAPRWLTRAIDRALGAGEGEAFLRESATPPPIGLRVRRGAIDDHVAALRAAFGDDKVAKGRVVTSAILVHGAGDPRRFPGVSRGDLVVQEEGSQAVGEALGALPGERVLDACAGRGHKAILLADAVGERGRVDVADLHGKKLDRLREEAERAGATVGDAFEVDWSVGPGDVPEAVYDRVLVDAPCTGVGTIRRRPEILLKRTKEGVAEIAELQGKILANAARAAKPGGAIVYAVCSPLVEEMEDVVARVPGLSLDAVTRLAPQRDGTDGYAFAKLRRDQ